MSTKRDRPYLLVVTVRTGRKFPHRPTESVRIDVRFDGQLLSSLPVPLSEEPVFDTDMAFRLTGKELKDHKVQRTPIKIEVNRVSRRGDSVERIGYQTLDLRSYAVEVGSPRFAWFPLLGAQAMRGKPEINIGVQVDEDEELQNLQNEERAQAEFTRSARNKNYWITNHPLLVENPDGLSHYQIGPSKDSTHLFSLRITIAYVSHLDQFFEPSISSEGSQFFLHYQLFDNHLTTQPFDDFNSADLVTEHVAFRLRSNFDLLREYFLHQKHTKIRLCQGDGNIIAQSELSFTDLFPPDLQVSSLPFTFEKEIELHPVPDNKFGIPESLTFPEGQTPIVGVHVEIGILQKIESSGFSRTLTLGEAKPFMEEINKMSQSLRPKSAKTVSSANSKAPPRSKSTHGFSQLTEDEMRSFSSLSYPAAELPEDSTKHRHEPNREMTKYFEQQDQNNEATRKTAEMTRNDDQRHTSHKSSSTQISPPPVIITRKTVDEQVETHPEVKIVGTQTAFTDQDSSDNSAYPSRRYVCTIFLYKIRVTSPSFRYSSPVYLRYQYPFFGSAIPIVTRPPVEIHPNQDAILNNALTQFTFACSEAQLLKAFRTAPVCIEVWRSGVGVLQDEIIGQAKLRLDWLYRAETTTLYENEKPYLRRSYETTLEVIDLQSERYPKLADVTVCATLDDYGDLQRQLVNAMPTPVESRNDGYRPEVNIRSQPGYGNRANVVDLEKQAAVELEIWKDREERKFKAQLKKREDETLQNLTQEWERKTKQQKVFVEDNLQMNKALEDDLKRMIMENRKKEDDLKERERRIAEAEQYLKSEKTRLTRDIEEMQRTVLQEYSKRLELERSAQTLLKAEIKQQSSQIDELKKRLAEREEEVVKLRDADRQKPLQQQELQQEVNRLTLEKNDLERRVQSEMEAKTHYKQEWGKASKEVAKMRVRLESEHEKRLAEKDRELELLRAELAKKKQAGGRERTTDFSRDYQVDNGSVDSGRRKDRLAIQFGGGERKPRYDYADDVSDAENDENTQFDMKRLGLSESDSESDDETTSNPEKRLLEAMNQRNMLLSMRIYKLTDDIIVDIDKKIERLRRLCDKNA